MDPRAVARSRGVRRPRGRLPDLGLFAVVCRNGGVHADDGRPGGRGAAAVGGEEPVRFVFDDEGKRLHVEYEVDNEDGTTSQVREVWRRL